MIEDGLMEEVMTILKTGVNKFFIYPIGYKEAIHLLKKPAVSTQDFLDFLTKFKVATRNYAREQLIWFRKHQTEYLWVSTKDPEVTEKIVAAYKMSQKEFSEMTRSLTNRNAIQSTLQVMKGPSARRNYMIDLNELFLYDDGVKLRSRVLAINKLIYDYRMEIDANTQANRTTGINFE
jgi:hypothetical protein